MVSQLYFDLKKKDSVSNSSEAHGKNHEAVMGNRVTGVSWLGFSGAAFVTEPPALTLFCPVI